MNQIPLVDDDTLNAIKFQMLIIRQRDEDQEAIARTKTIASEERMPTSYMTELEVSPVLQVSLLWQYVTALESILAFYANRDNWLHERTLYLHDDGTIEEGDEKIGLATRDRGFAARMALRDPLSEDEE